MIHNSVKEQKKMDRDKYNPLDTGEKLEKLVKINITEISRERDVDNPIFPREYGKTFAALLMLISGFVGTTFTISIVHEFVPMDVKPLPDIVFSHLDRVPWAFKIAELIGMLLLSVYWIMIFFHRHRFIIMRRSWLMVGLLYLMRCVTIFVTVLPVPDTQLKCSPQVGLSATLIIKRAFQLMSGAGLSITGAHYLCGDYIFSGHTFMLTIMYLYIKEYTPARFYVFHWVIWLLSATGIFMVMAAHEHYCIDIVVAYWLATRMFWQYHTIANNKALQKRSDTNYLSREFWFPLIRWSEANVGDRVPNEYDWCLPWPPGLAGRTFLLSDGKHY